MEPFSLANSISIFDNFRLEFDSKALSNKYLKSSAFNICDEQQNIIKAWKKLPINASKNDNIYAIDKEYAGIPSHRIEYFINDFRKILENVRNK